MSVKVHPLHRDPDFLAKLPRYKTAWFPRENKYVGILSVEQRENIPTLTVRNGDDIWTDIHPTQLESFCL